MEEEQEKAPSQDVLTEESKSAKEYKPCKQFKVLVTSHEAQEFLQDALELLQDSCEVHFLPNIKDRELVVRYTLGMDGLLIDDPEVPIDKEFFRQAGLGLKVISIVGFKGDQVDMKEATKRRVKVGVCLSDLSLVNSAEVAIGLALALCRRVKEGHNSLLRETADIWNPVWLLGQDLKDCTCGIIGLGKLGSSIAVRLQGLRPKRLIYYSRRVKKVGYKLGIDRLLFDELIEISDIIFLCLPCNTSTRGMFNEELFMKMKRSSIIINVSHGGLIKINDLYCALRKGVIFGAGMDSDAMDAPSRKHPIQRMDNFILLPSISRNSALVKIRMYTHAVQNLISGLVHKKMLIPWNPCVKEEAIETEEERLVREQLEEEKSNLNKERTLIELKDYCSQDQYKGEIGELHFLLEEHSVIPDWT